MLTGLALAVTPVAASRLILQSTKGTARVCDYEVRPGISDHGRNRLRQMRVGLAEPCPSQYREPAAAPEIIPSTARLTSQGRRGDRTICFYTNNDRQYARTIAAGLQCPLTPHF